MSSKDVKKDVPWDLKISPELSETPHPTDEEIDIIRRFSPATSAGRELAMVLTMANLINKAKGDLWKVHQKRTIKKKGWWSK